MQMFCIFVFQGMHLMYEHLALLDNFDKRHESLMEGVTSLDEEMQQFRKDIATKVSGVLARTPLVIQPKKIPTDIDSEDLTCEDLPPPIVPQVC